MELNKIYQNKSVEELKELLIKANLYIKELQKDVEVRDAKISYLECQLIETKVNFSYSKSDDYRDDWRVPKW